MGTRQFSNRPHNANYFDLARKAELISNRLKNENSIRVHWLNEEFEKLEERIQELSSYFEHNDTHKDSLLLGRKNLQHLVKALRLIDSKFVEVDYLDETNKKIALTDIENQVKDVRSQLKFLEKNYLLH